MSHPQYPHVFSQVYGQAWLIDVAKFNEIDAVVQNRLMHGPLDLEMKAETGRPSKRELRESRGDIAIIGVRGTITPRPSIFSSGGTSCSEIIAAIDDAIDDPDVGTLVLDMDSPGGQTTGIPEAAARIAEAAKEKPVHCVANYLIASACYWLAAQCTSISCSPSSKIGSIGAVAKFASYDEANKAMGKSVMIVRSSPKKMVLDSDEPMSKEGIEYLQKEVAMWNESIIRAVAKGRGVSLETVRSPEWGEGGILTAKDAVDCGMADRVATMEEVLDMLKSGGDRSRMSAKRKRDMA